ncbi:MAG: hypothetical protein LBK72_03035, partial [Bifidobacteriaceae bacterium]|nr:hypothetical protein [Bifidobacteriaceae bacterium]
MTSDHARVPPPRTPAAPATPASLAAESATTFAQVSGAARVLPPGTPGTIPTPDSLAAQAAAAFAQVSGVGRHEIALVLGSGWGGGAERIGQVSAAVPAQTIPGFAPSSVPGHAGQLVSVKVADADAHALVITARSHYYERRDPQSVAHPIRMAAHAGARVIVLTNGCGAIRPWAPGTIAVIRDHLNLTGASPLVGAEFVDLTDLYTARLRAIVHGLFPDLPDAVYAQF